MKILFLDIDGCLNAHEKLPSGYCGICRPMADRLNRILDAVPDVQIVVSSAWRYMVLNGAMTLKGFEFLLLAHGIKCFDRVHGTTDLDDVPEGDHFDLEWWNEVGMRMRADQIAAYLYDWPRPYVVIDDLPLNIQAEHFVQTDGAVGLTDSDAERVIAILAKD